jgi:hypothetical protein
MSELKIKQIKIETINPMYDAIEDRIRLSFNHKHESNHVDFMLTRKLLLQLLPSYEEYMFKVYSNEPLEQTVPKNKYARLSSHKQLKAHQLHPTLLSSIQFSYIEKTQQTLLSFQSSQINAYVTLNHKAFVEIINIIKSTIPYFDWGISPDL